ncbi:MAG: hypothetical protein AAGK32_16050, partial [Actinomycetota bacterium]
MSSKIKTTKALVGSAVVAAVAVAGLAGPSWALGSANPADEPTPAPAVVTDERPDDGDPGRESGGPEREEV